LNYSAHPDATNNFAEASFSCVVPAGKPRAILFLAGGTDSDVRPSIQDARWRALAERESLVLIAACLRGAGEAYEVASQGSGQALLDAVAAFGQQSGRTELGRLPLILYGYSAGGQFAFHFACWKPERVEAIVCVKSGPLPQPLAGKTPQFCALFIVGERDQPGRVREVTRAFAAGRSTGAPWCLAFQPDAGHGSEGCRNLAESFIGAANPSASGTVCYAQLSSPDHLGTGATTGLATDSNYSWLPSASFSKVWRGFVKVAVLQKLLALPDEKPEKLISWRPVTAFPDRIDGSKERVRFEYAISLPDDPAAIKNATVSVSNAAITAAATRLTDREWRVSGECDLRHTAFGPFRSQLQVELLLANGVREQGHCNLFARLTGPVAIWPSSIYYGVIGRDATAVFDMAIRPAKDHQIRSCEVDSSDPEFLAVAVSPDGKNGEYRAKCVLRSGTRIGARYERLTFRVETNRPYIITVPFYGFIKK